LARFRAVGRHFALAWPALAEPWNSLLMTSQDFQAELASVLNRRFEMSHTKDIDFSALGISACREAGYAATWNALERANWRGKFDRLKA